jgi:hypothetical protein
MTNDNCVGRDAQRQIKNLDKHKLESSFDLHKKKAKKKNAHVNEARIHAIAAKSRFGTPLRLKFSWPIKTWPVPFFRFHLSLKAHREHHVCM